MQMLEHKLVIARVKSLPTLPQIFYKIIELVESPDSSVSDLEKIVRQDPSIAAKVLKVANSPLFTFGKQCVDIHQAIVRLGFETLKSIVLSISIFKFTPGRAAISVFSREDFWRHSVGAGEAARLTAKAAGYPNPDGAYLIGLIHDIGKVILDFFFASEYEQIGLQVKRHNCTILQAEREVLGLDHAVVGGWLAEQWKFPEQLISSIQFHHDIPLSPPKHRVQTSLAALGDFVARKENFGSGGDNIEPAAPESALHLKDFSSVDIDLIRSQFRTQRELIEETCRLVA